MPTRNWQDAFQKGQSLAPTLITQLQALETDVASALAGSSTRSVVIVAAFNAPAKWIASADYVCDGVNDHVEIQAAVDYANNGGAAVDNSASAIGGKVLLSPGIFKDIDQIVLKSRVNLQGQGIGATRLIQKTNANKDFVINYVSSNGTEANAQQCEINDVTLNGNRAALYGAPGGNTLGQVVNFTQNPSFTKATNDIDYDANYRMSNVWLLNGATKGYSHTGRCHGLYERIYAYYNGTIGIQAGTDSYWMGCASGQSGNQGWLVDGNATLVGCVSFYSGFGNVSAYPGYEITSSQGAYLSGCRAQDCGREGFYLNGTTATQIIGGQADSCGAQGTASQYANIGLNNALNCMIIGLSSTDRGASNGSFAKAPCGLSFAGTNTSNRIEIEHVGIAGGTVGTTIKSGSGPGAKNYIRTNATDSPNILGGPGSPFTPLPLLGTTIEWTMTTALTVNVPAATDSWPGQRLRFVWIQDGTGGRNITWGAGYVTNWSNTGNTAGKRQTIEYEYDGTSWNQIGSCSGWM